MSDLGKHFNVLIAVVVVSSLLAGTAAWVSRHNWSARLGVVDLQQLRGRHPRARHLNELASNINEDERFCIQRIAHRIAFSRLLSGA